MTALTTFAMVSGLLLLGIGLVLVGYGIFIWVIDQRLTPESDKPGTSP